MATVELIDVRKTYRDVEAVKRLNLRIDPDDRIALLGKNGNGKTTLARLLAAADLHTTTAPADAIELSIRVHATREFGLVLSAGAGGLDGALDPANFARDRAAVHAAVELTDGEDFLERFRRTIAWQRITALAARRGVQPPDAALARLFEAALQLAAGGLPDAPGAQAALQELALDCACDGEAVRVVAARCSVGAPPPLRVARPIHKIDRLLHPERIGIVGASASGMNFGRIILRNLLGSGCAPERLCVIRPGGGDRRQHQGRPHIPCQGFHARASRGSSRPVGRIGVDCTRSR